MKSKVYETKRLKGDFRKEKDKTYKEVTTPLTALVIIIVIPIEPK